MGHLPDEAVLAMRAFLDFCYLVRRSVLTDETLKKVDEALRQFLQYRKIFQEMGVQMSFSFPRLHSVVHYNRLIRYFGAPNGICTSISENKHIDAVKKPWRRSNRYNALSQMLTTNSRLDKLRASRISFQSRGMLCNSFSNDTNNDTLPNDGGGGDDDDGGGGDGDGGNEDAAAAAADDDDDDEDDDDINDLDAAQDGPTILGSLKLALTPRKPIIHLKYNLLISILESNYPHHLQQLSEHTGFQNLVFLVQKFLYRQMHPEQQGDVPPTFLPHFNPRVNVFHSATATFHAPSDPSGKSGMKREQIRSCPSWRKGSPRYDTVFVETDPDKPGMLGMHIARVFLFFSFKFQEDEYPCALINWFVITSDTPDRLTGMWLVSPEYLEEDDKLSLSVIHVDSILRAAHLIPYFGEDYVADLQDIDASQTLDNFNLFYVNKYIDHHAFEIVY